MGCVENLPGEAWRGVSGDTGRGRVGVINDRIGWGSGWESHRHCHKVWILFSGQWELVAVTVLVGSRATVAKTNLRR